MHPYLGTPHWLDQIGVYRKTSMSYAVTFSLRGKEQYLNENSAAPEGMDFKSAIPCKNTVSANIKHNRYFRSIHSYAKRLCRHMYNMVDTAFQEH